MRVTSKGQVTIPQAIREQAGIRAGNEVEFCFRKGEIVLRKTAGPTRGEELIRRMAGRGSGTMSTDEIMELTRG